MIAAKGNMLLRWEGVGIAARVHRTHTHTLARTHTRSHTHTHTLAHMHTDKNNVRRSILKW